MPVKPIAEQTVEELRESCVKLQGVIDNERKMTTTAKAALAPLNEKVEAQATQIAQLTSVLASSPTAETMQGLIDAAATAKVAAATAESQKRITALEGQLGEVTTARDALSGQLNTRTIEQSIRDAAARSHVLPSAIDTLLTLGKVELKLVDGKTVTEDGRNAYTWLEDSKLNRGYMWPKAVGSGARGSGADGMPPELDNPFSAATLNLTKQGQLVRDNPMKAERLKAEAAATARQ